MDFLSYFLVSIASFSGLLAGASLAFISPEEMKPGRKYFLVFIKVIFVVIAATLALFLGAEKLYISIAFVFVCAAFIIRIPQKFIYPMLGVFFYASSKDAALLPLVASLIFLLGLPKGTIFAAEHFGVRKKRILQKIVIVHSMFFIIALPLYFSNL